MGRFFFGLTPWPLLLSKIFDLTPNPSPKERGIVQVLMVDWSVMFD
jgi:hypothetical protein